jgi:hypothetical protein
VRTTQLALAAAMLATSIGAAHAEERTVLELSGTGLKNTRPFTVSDGWELQYTAYPTDAIYFIVVLNAEDGSLVDGLANQTEAGSGSSYQAKGGTFTLSINAAGRWHIKIVQVEPGY